MPQPRRPTRRTAAILALAFGCASTTAFADETAPSRDDDRIDEDDAPLALPGWAVIFGAGASPLAGTAGGGTSVGGLGGPWVPIVFGGFEARMLPRLWLIGEVRGSVEQSRYDDGHGDGTITHWGLGGDLGIRHVLTDPEPLELSWVLVARGQYGESILPDDGAEAWAYGVSGRMGLVLQHHFTSWLALRARVDLLEAGYQRARHVQSYEPQTLEQDRWFARVTAEPSIAMRFGF